MKHELDERMEIAINDIKSARRTLDNAHKELVLVTQGKSPGLDKKDHLLLGFGIGMALGSLIMWAGGLT